MPLTFKSSHKDEKGFALIAAITLMLLLALISVGVMTLAASVTRSTTRGKVAEEARAQARLALQIAIGRLQADLGPDQRITAMSGILSNASDESSTQGVSNPYILGVWNSWDSWLNRANSQGTKIQQTYTEGRSSQFRRWLISGADENLLRKWDAVKSGSTLGKSSGRDKSQVLMLGRGTVGKNAQDKNVYAGLIEIDTTPTADLLKTAGTARENIRAKQREGAGNKNFIAWWVTGENLKARINKPKYRQRASNPIDALKRAGDTPTPDTNMIPGLEDFASSLPSPTSPEYDKKVATIFTRGTLALSTTSNSKGEMEFFHDVTLDSSGVLADVKFGGLKKDLSLLMSQDNLDNTEYFENNGADVGIRPLSSEDSDDSIAVAERPTASWKQLFYWSNLWDGQAKTNQDVNSPLIWENSTPKTYIAADPKSTSNKEVMNNRYTYLRQPILLKMYVFLGLEFRDHGNTDFPGLDVLYASRPTFVWWNPYNVPLETNVNGKNFAGMGFPYRTLPIQQSNRADINVPPQGGFHGGYGHTYGRYCVTWSKPAEICFNRSFDGKGGNFADPGNIFKQSSKDDNLVFKPGEIKVFTHDVKHKLSEGETSYTMTNTSAGVLDRRLTNVNANPFTNEYVGHEITYNIKEENTYPAAFEAYIPVIHKYGKDVDYIRPPDFPTLPNISPGWVVGFAWFWREDFEKTFIRLSMPAGLKNLHEPDVGGLSLYQLFFKDGANDDRLNFCVGAGIIPESNFNMAYDKTKYGDAFDLYFPSFFNINWVNEKPFDFIEDPEGLNIPSALFDVMWDGPGMPPTLGIPKNEGNPFWVSYYGISPKGLYPPSDVNSRYPKNADLRTKIWQHSPITLWGSQMTNPSDIVRQYHPYQFEIKRRQKDDFTQLDIISGDVVGQIVGEVADSELGSGAYFGYRDEDMVSTIVASELPIYPPFSLASFSGARLSPGWFDDQKIPGNTSFEGKRATRIAYQSGVPGVGIGNSYADPMIQADKVHFNFTEQNPAMADYWDHAFLVNDGIWDTWFVSSISKRPTNFGSGVKEVSEVVQEFVNNSLAPEKDSNKMLPNTQLKLQKGLKPQQEIISELSNKGSKNWEKSAKYLTNEGAFNVNSTSIAAWTAVLNALKDRQVSYGDEKTGAPRLIADSGQGNDIYLTRFAVASSNETRDDKPLLSIERNQNRYAWSDLRKITASQSASDRSQIRLLAQEIVKEVKKRGPFLNMADFINRRLTGANDETSTYGALQTAIDKAGLNDAFNNQLMLNEYAAYNNPKASGGSQQTAAPGYLIQSDILSGLGNSLTVRDDTFIIRAYGQVSDPSGTKIESRAWCEAVVQRSIDYVDPSNDPETPAIIINHSTGQLSDSNLSKINRAFGRKFKILSFRWLAPDEV